MQNGNSVLTLKEAANYLKIKLSTIYNWSCRGILPACKLGGRLNRYRKSDLDNFINSNMIEVQTQ
ncbi:MAG: helix-turn-helix domain-containing protein [Candidatus Jettenia caeni]|nr:helix-turn-helix domain-containing protein [Candidatus Jettenia caeni]